MSLRERNLWESNLQLGATIIDSQLQTLTFRPTSPVFKLRFHNSYSRPSQPSNNNGPCLSNRSCSKFPPKRCQDLRLPRIRTTLRIFMIHFSPHKNHFFSGKFSPQSIFYPLFLNEESLKMAELGENVLVSCIIDFESFFDDIQLCPRQFCFNLNICKVMMIFFKFWPKKIRTTVNVCHNFAV